MFRLFLTLAVIAAGEVAPVSAKMSFQQQVYKRVNCQTAKLNNDGGFTLTEPLNVPHLNLGVGTYRGITFNGVKINDVIAKKCPRT